MKNCHRHWEEDCRCRSGCIQVGKRHNEKRHWGKRGDIQYIPSACLNYRGSLGFDMIVPGMNLNAGGGFLGGGRLLVSLGSRTRVVTLEQGKVVLTTVKGVSGQLSLQPQVEAGKSNQEDIELGFEVVTLLCSSEGSVNDKV